MEEEGDREKKNKVKNEDKIEINNERKDKTERVKKGTEMKYMYWTNNACHLDSFIICLRSFFLGLDPQIYQEESLERKLCQIINKLDNMNITRDELTNERNELWNWAVDEGFPRPIGSMAEVSEWLNFLW